MGLLPRCQVAAAGPQVPQPLLTSSFHFSVAGPGAHVTWLEKAASFSLQVKHIIDVGGGEREALWSLPLWIPVCPCSFLLTSSFSSQVQALLTGSPFRPPTEPQRHPPKDFSTSSHHPHNKSLIPYHSDWLCLPHYTLTDSHSSSQETGF